MSRTKIEVDVAVLGRKRKPLHVNVASGTTCVEVIEKVLEKLRCRDAPIRYQLWAVAAERGESAGEWELE